MELKKNKYTIAGLPVIDLARKHGSPLYIYDTAVMIRQYERITSAFSHTTVKINYACKALTNINVLKLFKGLGSGLDAVSVQEVELGLKAGFAPQDILYTPNCVSIEEIDEAVELGVRINIDNIAILEEFGHKYGRDVPVCIRINPHVLGGGNNKISTGHIDSKFGISIYQMPHAHRIVETNHMKVEGIHMHTGSDILDMETFLRASEIMFETAKEFKELDYVDFGSGFKVPYKADDVATDVEALGKDLSLRFNQFCDAYGKELTLIFEPGKFLVSEAGYFVARVNVIKQTTSTVFAGLDTGMNHFIRPMFYDSYHEIVNVSKPGGKTRIYTVVGYICETDTFGWNRKISEAGEGDYLLFKNAGAYCYAMSSNYNSRFRPAEVLVHNGKDHLIRRRENMEDLLRNQLELDISNNY
ncbi:MAG: diaminopimelate decarboxylase [Bacteroidetes bacterium]|nr:MAG: diaminopimelate decarboxylase [Bacteroidota bacterium]RLD71271.1 MAG: diaminopimelate decarboxylase [Bacteroidota bacterium]RLD91393.1 MAG: diaminopimelate decarboxylase [Bacteroidota bacterium]RLE02100.1 MAG: diaminopimelate decarboxylase [Bacteroidota bacterium]